MNQLVPSTFSALGGFAVGVGLMYLLDPDQGFQRRKKLRRQALRAGRRGAELALEARSLMAQPSKLFA